MAFNSLFLNVWLCALHGETVCEQTPGAGGRSTVKLEVLAAKSLENWILVRGRFLRSVFVGGCPPLSLGGFVIHVVLAEDRASGA